MIDSIQSRANDKTQLGRFLRIEAKSPQGMKREYIEGTCHIRILPTYYILSGGTLAYNVPLPLCVYASPVTHVAMITLASMSLRQTGLKRKLWWIRTCERLSARVIRRQAQKLLPLSLFSLFLWVTQLLHTCGHLPIRCALYEHRTLYIDAQVRANCWTCLVLPLCECLVTLAFAYMCAL